MVSFENGCFIGKMHTPLDKPIGGIPMKESFFPQSHHKISSFPVHDKTRNLPPQYVVPDISGFVLFTVDNILTREDLDGLRKKVSYLTEGPKEESRKGRQKSCVERKWRLYGVAGSSKYLVVVFPLDYAQSDEALTLTEREKEIISLVSQGLTRQEIERRLTFGTVNYHLDKLYKKLGVSSNAEAVVAAMEHRLLEVDEEVLKTVPVESFDGLLDTHREVLDIFVGRNDRRKPVSSAKEIARMRVCAVQTIKNLFTDIYKRIPVRTQAQLAAWYWIYSTQREPIAEAQEESL